MATKYTSLPVAYSNKRVTERLRSDAAASLHRMSLRMVPGADANFSIWSALRTHAEQVALFRQNYVPAGRGRRLSSDRGFQGQIWKKRPGGVNVASPDVGSNHQNGLAIDIHPGAIQNWIKSNGRRFGWDWAEGRRNGEDWHFRYYPSLDQYKGEGTPRIADMQRKLGVTADAKIGTGTVAAIRDYQRANGLTVDGIAGPATQAAILGTVVSAPSPGMSVPVPSPGATVAAASSLDIDRSKSSPNHNTDRRGHEITEITIHWWGKPSGQSHDGIVNHLCNPASEVSAHYVVSPGKASQLVDEAHRSWANGDADANSQAITIECDPNDILGTLPVLAALIADIRGRHGNLPLVPHSAHVSTECPGDYLPLLDDIDAMADGATVTVTLSGSAGTPGTVGEDGRLGRETSAELQGRLGVTADGMFGPASFKALQRYLGAPHIDGKISRQPQGALDLGNGYRRDCIEVGPGKSQMVMLWQAYVGATVDGRLGEETIERTQIQLNASPSSFTADHASTVKLRTKGVLDTISRPVKASGGLKVDGRWGTSVTSALQRFLNSRGADLKVDGRMGPEAWKALQRYLGHPVVDGLIEHQSYKPTELGNGISPNGWRYTGRGSKGSKTIRRLQKWIGVTQDGVVFEGTTKALQRKLNDHGFGG